MQRGGCRGGSGGGEGVVVGEGAGGEVGEWGVRERGVHGGTPGGWLSS